MSEPWKDEPNRVEWKHAGLNCLINRGPHGALCGYVGVPLTHPLHGKDYEDIEVNVHGGLTYAGLCDGVICHKPEEGEKDHLYWFGFDCAHAWDLIPSMRNYGDAQYRDIAYVTAETNRLAEQLAARSS